MYSYRFRYSAIIERGKVTDATPQEIKEAKEKSKELNDVLQNVMHRKDTEYLRQLVGKNKTEITITCEFLYIFFVLITGEISV